jgi:hypothetical protein
MLGAFIGGALGLAGSIFGSKSASSAASAQAAAQERVNQQQIDFAREQMHYQAGFEREVLQNRNQWSVEDLKLAGLNPMLTAMQPSSAQGSISAPHANLGNPEAGAVHAAGIKSQAVNTGINSALAFMELENAYKQQRNQDTITASQVEMNSALAEKYRSESDDVLAKTDSKYWMRNSDYWGASADESRGRAREIQARIVNLGQQMKESDARIKQYQADTEVKKSELGRISAQIKQLHASANESNKSAKLREAQAEYSRVQADLGRSEKLLTDEWTKTQEMETASKGLDVLAKQLGIPALENKYEYETGTGTKFWKRHFPIKLPYER